MSADPKLDKSIMSLEFHDRKHSREEEMRNTREGYIRNIVKDHLYFNYHFVCEFSLVDEELIVWKG